MSAGLRTRPPVLLIYAITVTGILNNTLIGPAIPDILDDLDVGESSAGFLVASGSLPGIVVAPLIGLLADRFGRRTILVPCLVVFGLGGAAGAFAPNFTLLLAARLVQGFGTAGLINLGIVLIGDHWRGAERTALIGRNAAILTLALAFVPPIGGVLADTVGWRGSFLVYLVGLLTAAAVMRVLPHTGRVGDMTVREQLRSAGAAVRHPVAVATLLSGTTVFVLIFGLFLTVLPVHLESEFDLGASQRGLMLAVPALSSCLVAFNLGRLRERFGIRLLLIGAAVVYVIAFAGIAAAPTLALVIGAAVFYGFGEGVFIPALQDAMSEVAPPAQRGALIAVWVGAARLGQTAGPLLAAGGLALMSSGSVFAVGAAVAAALLVGQALGPTGRAPHAVAAAPGA